MSFIPAELIKKKKLGAAHSREEIRWIVQAFTSGELPDYQMSAWAMAVWFKGMVDEETAALTEAMRDSGAKFNFSHLKGPRLDKHSTGGVGDKTSLIIGPILAAAHVYVPMIAGRGLGHTGGTLDKLESIPGFRVNLPQSEFEKLIEEKYFALMGQTKDICPADRKLYALRDVTSTVDSLPLICGSIMSKKLAEDLTGLVLDVKFGSGAFMKTVDEARALATLLKSTGEKNGVKVSALISNMNQPLGRFVGNAVEVKECVDIMMGHKCEENEIDFYYPTRQLSLELAGHMLWLAGKANTPRDGFALAEELLTSGAALRAFYELIKYQGPGDLEQLPKPHHFLTIEAQKSGYIKEINTELIGLAGIRLGAGRKTATDTIDYSAGIEIQCQLGMKISDKQVLFSIFCSTKDALADAAEILNSAVRIADTPPKDLLPLVVEVLP